MFNYVLLLGDIVMDTGQLEAADEAQAEQLIKGLPGCFDRYVIQEVKA